MPTTYTDQFFVIDPYSPPPAGTSMTFQLYDLVDQNDDFDIDRFNNDRVDGQDVQSSWPGDRVNINIPGVGNVTYVGITFYLADGRQVFTPTDGQVLQNGTLNWATGVTTQGPLNTLTDLGPTCFVAGTLIETMAGPQPIETLKVGDLIPTRDHGPQPIRWIGRQQIDARGDLAPIRFAPKAIGNETELSLSPNHRVLVQGWQAELFFGEDEILVAAKHLVNHDTIHRAPMDEVEYLHLLFDDYEIIESHGILSESFYPAAVMDNTDRDAQREIITLFPEVIEISRGSAAILARPAIKAYEATLLAA